MVIDTLTSFVAYIIDYCEGDEITEEGMQRALADFMKSEHYWQLRAKELMRVDIPETFVRIPSSGRFRP